MASYENKDLESVEMASRVKKEAVLKVRWCQVYFGVCTTKLNAYETTLGTYDLIAGMDLLQGYKYFMDLYAKEVMFLDYGVSTIQIHGWKRKLSLCFISGMKSKRFISDAGAPWHANNEICWSHSMSYFVTILC